MQEKPRATQAGWRAVVTTFAGEGAAGSQDGAPRAAKFAEPFGVALGGDGSVYVADAGEGNRVRKVTPQGEVSTLAGGREGFADGAGAAAAFNTPSGVAADGEGNLYVADTGNNRIRKITKEGVVTTLAGDGAAGFREGAAAQAQFDAPVGVAADASGNLYVADTYNDRVRVVTKEGLVKTVAGAGRPGHADGDALTAALFDTPCAVAVSAAGEIYVADTGNNRIRKITKEGVVTTLHVFAPADAAAPGAAQRTGGQDAAATNAGGEVHATNAANANVTNAGARGVDANANVGAQGAASGASQFDISKPAGLVVAHDGFLYVTELDRSRVLQIAPDGAARVIAGLGPGFADGDGQTHARFNQPAGLALAPDGSLFVADAANYLVRRVGPAVQAEKAGAPRDEKGGVRSLNQAATAEGLEASSLPRIAFESFPRPFPWPLDPQGSRHEVSATMGEVRGSYGTDDSRHHLHSGVDVFGVYGQTVRAVLEEKVSSPLANWGFGGLNEGMRVGLISYVHMRVGRDERDGALEGAPFIHVRGDDGRVARVRIRRGTRVRVGDALGTLNRMYHVHMNLGPPGAEVNPLALPFPGFSDSSAPKIEPDGVQFFGESGERLKEKRGGRLLLRGKLRIVLDAYDQVDGNRSGRRLGLYRAGYQLLAPDGSPAPGFERPRVNIEFNRLPPDPHATKIAYADESGITVYGSKRTRFLYELTNTVRDGRAARTLWDTSELPPGDYVLRVVAADFSGNEAETNRDIPVTIEGER